MLLEPGQEGLADFLAAHRVRVAASLPCYSAANVDEQRGGGVFGRSIQVIAKIYRVTTCLWQPARGYCEVGSKVCAWRAAMSGAGDASLDAAFSCTN